MLDTLGELPDPIPDDVRVDRGLLHYRRALELIHRPQKDSDWGAARKALRFREAFLLQAALLQQRSLLRAQPAEPRLPKPGGFLERFDSQLPFTLTHDQETVGAELASDLASAVPMNRLLQGEVGSGKTLVALRGMLAVADSGGQSALLAPTEVLAAQHLRSIVQILGPDLAAELRPTLITGQLPQSVRKKALLSAISGQSHIVVGTHALLSESVGFYDLGLIVVDEQHRFGVEQREALRRKGSTPPHTLVLTATPIPRTVAMTVFGDLDISTIAELPSGRIPIVTHVVPLAEKPGWSEPNLGQGRGGDRAGPPGVRGLPGHRRGTGRRGCAGAAGPRRRHPRRPAAGQCHRHDRGAAEEPAARRRPQSKPCTADCPARPRTN